MVHSHDETIKMEMSSYEHLVEKVLPFKTKVETSSKIDVDAMIANAEKTFGGKMSGYVDRPSASSLILKTAILNRLLLAIVIPSFIDLLLRFADKMLDNWQLKKVDNYFISVDHGAVLVSSPVEKKDGTADIGVRIVFGVVKDKVIYASNSEEHLTDVSSNLEKLTAKVRSVVGAVARKFDTASMPIKTEGIRTQQGSESSKLLSYAKGKQGYTVIVLKKGLSFNFKAMAMLEDEDI